MSHEIKSRACTLCTIPAHPPLATQAFEAPAPTGHTNEESGPASRTTPTQRRDRQARRTSAARPRLRPGRARARRKARPRPARRVHASPSAPQLPRRAARVVRHNERRPRLRAGGPASCAGPSPAPPPPRSVCTAAHLARRRARDLAARSGRGRGHVSSRCARAAAIGAWRAARGARPMDARARIAGRDVRPVRFPLVTRRGARLAGGNDEGGGGTRWHASARGGTRRRQPDAREGRATPRAGRRRGGRGGRRASGARRAEWVWAKRKRKFIR